MDVRQFSVGGIYVAVKDPVARQSASEKYTKPVSGIPTEDLASNVQAALTDAQKQSDWNQTDNTKADFIKNKPTTNRAFKDGWPTSTTLDAFCSAIVNDATALVGDSYFGNLTCSGLPTGIESADVIVDIKGTALAKVLVLTITSSSLAPYHWELTYTNGTATAWRSFMAYSVVPTSSEIENVLAEVTV